MTEETAAPPVQLPPCPEGFDCRSSGFGCWPGQRMPRWPRNLKFVASVEFSMGITNSYGESYGVRTTRKNPEWELWSVGYDDLSESEIRQVQAVGPYMRIPPKVAAIHLLAAAWKDTYQREPWYMVIREGLVSADEINAIFQMIFPASACATVAEPVEPETPTTEEIAP